MWSVLESYHSHVREIIKAARARGTKLLRCAEQERGQVLAAS